MSGYEIRTIEGLGRAAVATKDFAIGDLIIAETPVLQVPTTPSGSSVFTQLSTVFMSLGQAGTEIGSEFMKAAARNEARFQANAIVAFLDLSEADRDIVLRNFALPSPPQNSSNDALMLMDAFATAAASLGGSMPPAETLKSLLKILATNAHEFVEDGAVYVGLYEKGSKLAHSCSPKTVYLGDGRTLKHYAVQPIKAGDVITTNYTVRDDIRACHPTHLRRAHLLRTKFFHCECTRCIAPDVLRTIPCDTCKGAITPATPCSAGCPPKPWPGAHEERLETSIAEATAPFDNPYATGPEIMSAFKRMNVIASLAEHSLGPHHWISNWVLPFRAMQARSSGDAATAGAFAIRWCRWSRDMIKPHYPHIHARHLVSMGMLCIKGPEHEEFMEIAQGALIWASPIFMGGDEAVRRLTMLAAGGPK
ncbi:hypothetical protein HDU86_002341 [Geranomyces michiganensis]|nr:hypothetical protein HDU86_002341 [Geranomyces michiganensis]